MLEVLLEPESRFLRRRARPSTLHQTLRQRTWNSDDCDCASPWLRIRLAKDGEPENPKLREVEACCPRRLNAVRSRLFGNESGHVGNAKPPRTIRVLLADCKAPDGYLGKDAAVVAECELPAVPALERDASLLLRCEEPIEIGGVRIRTLLVRGFFSGPNVEEALHRFQDLQVIAYWRRRGFDWTPRALTLAKRFGVGIGGSFTAKLTRLPSIGDLLSSPEVRDSRAPEPDSLPPSTA